MIVAFDIDGTLINDEDEWRMQAVSLARGFTAAGATLWVWSFGGMEYARIWARRLAVDHAIPIAASHDKLAFLHPIGGQLVDGVQWPDLHVDDVWSPRGIPGIILPYPEGATRWVSELDVHDQGPRFG